MTLRKGGQASDPSILEPRVSQAEQDIVDSLKSSPSIVSAFWNPPVQPAARTEIAGYFADGFNWTAQQYIDNLWEPLRQSNTGYITRTSLGKDQSGTYDVWKYVFAPPSYEKTMIIGAGIHGGETTAMMAVYRTLYHMVNNWRDYPQLSYLRHKVRLIVLPIQNPWGMSQQPRTRQNSTGVDLNRNFDYKWADFVGDVNPFDHDYKGTAPFSEIESQYIRDVLSEYPDATAYIDNHNLGSVSSHFVLYTPEKLTNNRKIFRDVIDYLKQPSDTVSWQENEWPTAAHYAGYTYGFAVANPEFSDGVYSQQYDQTEMTKAVAWYGNIIIRAAAEKMRPAISLANEPFIVKSYYGHTSTSLILPKASYAAIPEFQISFTVPCAGIVKLDGAITIRGTDPTSQNFFTPRLYQVGSDEWGDVRRSTFWDVYSEGSVRMTLPLHAEIAVSPSSDSGLIKEVIAGLYAYNTAGDCTAYRYRMRAEFIPLDRRERLTTYSATDRVGQGTNAMVKVYPPV